MVVGKMRNFVKRVEKKERSATSTLEKKGFIEHHKDYVRRAKRQHVYKDAVKGMRTKIQNKNEDEFYHEMENTRTINGMKIKLNNQLPPSAKAKLINNPLDKIPDSVIDTELRKETQRLEQNRQKLPIEKNIKNHIVFDDDDNEIPDKKLKKALRKHSVLIADKPEINDEDIEEINNNTIDQREEYDKARREVEQATERINILKAEKRRRMLRDAVKSKNVKVIEKSDGKVVICKNNRRH